MVWVVVAAVEVAGGFGNDSVRVEVEKVDVFEEDVLAVVVAADVAVAVAVAVAVEAGKPVALIVGAALACMPDRRVLDGLEDEYTDVVVDSVAVLVESSASVPWADRYTLEGSEHRHSYSERTVLASLDLDV